MADLQIPTYRMTLELPVGIRSADGTADRTAEVRAVTGADEFYIGMSPEYNKYPNDMVYKTLLLSRCVTRLGDRTAISITDIQKLHARDVRALEVAVYTLTYGEDALPKEDPNSPGA